MQPIVCRYISQAWKVKKAYDGTGQHVRIVRTRTVNKPYRWVWVCYIGTKPPREEKNPVLAFIKKLVKMSSHG